uniref:Uncharacterized protein n=1 Tax=Utricularia reniformis TaxID=192314 RepID=A0A1Y0B0U0_9LAMI|nr:hypothetical protein AEK19_MT0845 [Utricularia reniformis]YP_009382292.1 hypothetical protein AEK19_MT1864 [Utricularia reniformis]ART31076.1 hypothetical protein AEK19_MT0845 [Utricularia reniformis]ART32035.1 hypothetical protein AEK19_MT1864 [Utricularia reniformis]
MIGRVSCKILISFVYTPLNCVYLVCIVRVSETRVRRGFLPSHI